MADFHHLLMDLAGVLCHFDRETRLDALAEAAGISSARVGAAVYDSGLGERFDRGEYTAAEICAQLRADLGLAVPDDEIARLWATAFTPDEEVLALLDDVRPDVTRSLLTNNDALLRDFMPAVLPSVHARFGLPLFSSLTRALKPSPAAYTQALTLLGATPADSFFIDDSAANVEGAQAVGLTAVRFTDAATLARDLTAAGLLG